MPRSPEPPERDPRDEPDRPDDPSGPGNASDPRQRAEIERLCLRIADVIGGLMELWGFKRIMGRTWTVLYLSDEPLSAADLAGKLQISSGSVSMTINELLKWGVVKKTWVPGDRRDFYQPETSIWKMVSRVFRERELAHIRDAIAAFKEAQQVLDRLAAQAANEDGENDHGDPTDPRAAAGPPRPAPHKTIQFVRGRVKSLLALGEAGQSLLQLVLSGIALGGTPLPKLLDE